jgi:hypothetical protein
MIIRMLLLGFVLVTAAAGGASAENRAMYGAGTTSCGQWQEYRTTGNKGMSFQLEAWIDGYLSGFNVASTGPDYLANKPSNVAFYIWIDNYCRDKPLDIIVQAVGALKNELLTRAR